jgi:hypothetical protein
MAIRARAQKAGVIGGVFLAGGAEVVDDLAFGMRAGHVQRAVQTALGRDGGEQIVDGTDADFGQHLLAFGGGFWQVAHGVLFGVKGLRSRD